MEKEQNVQPLRPKSEPTEEEKKKMDEQQKFMKDVEEFARTHKKEYENEVAVLESIVQAKSFSVIPMSVHNLAVICPEQTYKYLQPIRDLYATIDLRNPAYEKIKEGTKMTLKNLDILIRQERTAYKNQANTLIAQRRKEGLPWNLKEESKYFEHVVYDPSMMLQEFFALVTQGVLLDSEQQKILGTIYDLVHAEAEALLILRKKAVESCDALAK